VNKLVLTAAVTAAITAAITVPVVTFAQADMAAGPWVCRQVKSGESAVGQVSQKDVICRAINVTRVKAALKQLQAMESKPQATMATMTQHDMMVQMQAAQNAAATLQTAVMPAFPGF